MARYVVDELGGQFPTTAQGLQSVPGIGAYVAAAIMVFCYRERAVLVDSNSVRFIARYSGAEFGGEARRNRELIEAMDELTPDDAADAVAFASGFLDFMRQVCGPSKPACVSCMLRRSCNLGRLRRRR